MSEDEATLSEREEIEMLLPWYVSGTLAASDRDRVERYLADHPDVRRQLDLIREERRETIIANEALPTASAGALDRLLASLPVRRGGLWRRLSESEGLRALALLVSPSAPRTVRFAAYAAAFLLLAQGVAITAFLLKGNEAGYQTAAGGAGSRGPSFFIAFTDAASSADVTSLLQGVGARIVDGPKPGGIYRIEVRSDDISPRTDEALRRRLAERRDLVRLVLPAKE
jgi:hypothetical protein